MYHALLPEKSVKALKAEYRIRLFVVLFFFLSLAVLASAICLVPSYVAASLEEGQARSAAASLLAGGSGSSAPVASDLSSAGALVGAISSFQSPPLSPVVLRIAALRSPGIQLTSIQVAYSGSASSTASLEGTAASRDDLVSFQHALEADADFAGVTVPISDLAPSSDLEFSLQMSVALPPSGQ